MGQKVQIRLSSQGLQFNFLIPINELGFNFGTLVITEKNAGVVHGLNVGGESRIAHSCCNSCLLYCTVREQIRFYYLLLGNER